jgi:signal recognition particle subunit SRP54
VDLNDFRQQISVIKNMGSVQDLVVKIPGLNQMSMDLGSIDADRVSAGAENQPAMGA